MDCVCTWVCTWVCVRVCVCVCACVCVCVWKMGVAQISFIITNNYQWIWQDDNFWNCIFVYVLPLCTHKSTMQEVILCQLYLTSHCMYSKNASLNQSVGVLSPVNHKGLHQGWKEMSIYLLVELHKSHQTTTFFKIHKLSLNTNIKQNAQTSCSYTSPSVWNNPPRSLLLLWFFFLVQNCS